MNWLHWGGMLPLSQRPPPPPGREPHRLMAIGAAGQWPCCCCLAQCVQWLELPITVTIHVWLGCGDALMHQPPSWDPGTC